MDILKSHKVKKVNLWFKKFVNYFHIMLILIRETIGTNPIVTCIGNLSTYWKIFESRTQ